MAAQIIVFTVCDIPPAARIVEAGRVAHHDARG